MTRKRRPLFEDPFYLLPQGLTKLRSVWTKMTYPFASIGSRFSIHYSAKLSRRRSCRISIGNSVILAEHSLLNVATEEPDGEPVIVLEDNCNVGFGSMISAKNGIHLESGVALAQSVLIIDHNHNYEDISVPIIRQGINAGGRIRIGEGTWIGRGAVVICTRGELTIGRHCVISVNSVIMRSIPDYSVVAGYPATIIKHYDPDTKTWRIGARGNRPTQNSQADAPPTADFGGVEVLQKS